MGAGGSTLEIPGGGTEGYQIIKVQENSPGERVGLEAYFDYIVAVNGNRLVREKGTSKGVWNENRGARQDTLRFSLYPPFLFSSSSSFFFFTS